MRALALVVCGGCAASGLLAVPDVRQATPYTCSAAALQAVLAYYGKELREGELATELGATPEDGAPPDAIVRVARAHGLLAELREGMTVADLRAAVRARRPVIVDLQAWPERPRPPADNWDDGHYVVLIGIEGNTLVFEDPSLLGSRGVLTAAQLEERWHDREHSRSYVHAGIVFAGEARPPKARVPIE